VSSTERSATDARGRGIGFVDAPGTLGEVKLPDSPHDRRVRNEALAHLGRRAAVVAVPTLLVGALANALGVPWWLVLIAVLIILYHGLLQS
jgi:hypothetical protein